MNDEVRCRDRKIPRQRRRGSGHGPRRYRRYLAQGAKSCAPHHRLHGISANRKIMSYLAQGKKTEDILGGVHSAIAARTISLVRRVGIEPEVTFTGGVSLNIGMVHALEEKLGMKLNVSPDSHFVGALGASIFALERADKASGEKQQATGIGAGPTA